MPYACPGKAAESRMTWSRRRQGDDFALTVTMPPGDTVVGETSRCTLAAGAEPANSSTIATLVRPSAFGLVIESPDSHWPTRPNSPRALLSRCFPTVSVCVDEGVG